MTEPAIPIAYSTAVPMATAPPRPDPQVHRPTRVMLHSDNYAQAAQDTHKPLSRSTIETLIDQGYTKGLAQSLGVNKHAFAMSMWIVDNSGSMSTYDGHRIVQPKNNRNNGALKFVSCTRWKEMQETVDYHAQMAALLQAPTVFRMLNDPGRMAGPQQFSIAEMGEDSSMDHDLAVAQSVMLNSQPGGVTPLTQHIKEIRENVIALEPELRRNGTKVAIVLATDGLPTDSQGYSNATVQHQFVQALRSLEGLPVWIVVRLCTDEDSIVEYWNDLDGQLELSLEVLDDFVSEAQEVHEVNKWLNYSLPLHRMREMGFYHRIFDLLDERKLSKDEVRDFLRMLFGTGLMDEAPDPEGDWNGFCETVSKVLAKEKKQWNPVSKRMEPWIDMKRLKHEYGQHGGGWLGLW